jgi:hypothetical protein
VTRNVAMARTLSQSQKNHYEFASSVRDEVYILYCLMYVKSNDIWINLLIDKYGYIIFT